MIEKFVRTLLEPLYNLLGLSIPILVILIVGIILFYFVGTMKMHIRKKNDSKKMDCYIPYFSDEDIDYVFTGKKI